MSADPNNPGHRAGRDDGTVEPDSESFDPLDEFAAEAKADSGRRITASVRKRLDELLASVHIVNQVRKTGSRILAQLGFDLNPEERPPRHPEKSGSVEPPPILLATANLSKQVDTPREIPVSRATEVDRTNRVEAAAIETAESPSVSLLEPWDIEPVVLQAVDSIETRNVDPSPHGTFESVDVPPKDEPSARSPIPPIAAAYRRRVALSPTLAFLAGLAVGGWGVDTFSGSGSAREPLLARSGSDLAVQDRVATDPAALSPRIVATSGTGIEAAGTEPAWIAMRASPAPVALEKHRLAEPAPVRMKSASAKTSPSTSSRTRGFRSGLTGSLKVTSKPVGALVTLDGRRVGKTPLSIPRVPTGSHVLRLELNGYLVWSWGVSVGANRSEAVTVSLVREPER
jgi:hypothetical protein